MNLGSAALQLVGIQTSGVQLVGIQTSAVQLVVIQISAVQLASIQLSGLQLTVLRILTSCMAPSRQPTELSAVERTIARWKDHPQVFRQFFY